MNTKNTTYWTELHTAAKNGDQAAVTRLINVGVNLDAVTKLDWTPLHFAAKYGYLDCCRLLIEAGASMVIPTKLRFFTPIHIAALEGHTDVVRLFLDSGVDINIRTAEGWTPLHAAVEHAHQDTVRFLLERGADPNFAKRATMATCPLHSAARNGRADIMRMLLTYGADPDCRNKHGISPRDWAVQLGFRHLVVILDEAMQPEAVAERKRIASEKTFVHNLIHTPKRSEHKINRGIIRNKIHQGDLEWIKQHESDVKTVSDREGITPLFDAVFAKQVEIVRYLLENGADPNPCMKGTLLGPFDFLLTNELYYEPEIVRLLLEHGADPNSRDSSGQTIFERIENILPTISLELLDLFESYGATIDPVWKKTVALRYAVETRNHSQAEQLLKDGADPNRTYQWDFGIPLMVAVQGNDNEMLRILLRYGAKYTELGPDDNSILCLAAFLGNFETVKILVESGVNASTASPSGSPLQIALKQKHQEIADYLIEQGAKIEKRPNWVDRSQYNPKMAPIFNAVSKGDSELIRQLIDQGADIHAVGDAGKTLLHVAAEEGRTQWVKYLLDQGLDINAEDIHGNTPLHWAVLRKKTEAVQYLLRRGASIDPPPKNISPIVYAIMLGRIDVLKKTIDNDPEMVNRRISDRHAGIYEQFPILVALENGHIEMVELLVERGASITASSNWYHHEGACGESALSFASRNGLKELLLFFLAKNINVNSKSSPSPALHCAASVEIAQILLDHGANPYLRSNNHFTALECHRHGNKDVAALLREVMSREPNQQTQTNE